MIAKNTMLMAALLSWFIAQLIKVILVLINERRFNFKKFIEAGGMPSSHTSLVVALTTAAAKAHGVESSIFAISTVFSLVVMYDAAGVRRAAGKQAAALNKLIKEFYSEKPRVDERLKELLGHTPVEVFAGALLGLVIGLLI